VSPEADQWWPRALEALESAKLSADVAPNSSASRAYYAAFSAVQAYLANAGIEVWKHRAVQEFVHRNLVKSGVWPKERGTDFEELLHWRAVGDYVARPILVTPEKAAQLIAAAERIIEAVKALVPVDVGPDG